MDSEDPRPSIFISHTHADRGVADALSRALAQLFKEQVSVMYSTSKEMEGGIAKGEDWFRWIERQVRRARVSLILLTPSSVQKPWVLWEAGAVQGVSIALGTEGERANSVMPIKFKLASDEVPSPFARTQVTDGVSGADMKQFFSQLVIGFASVLKGFQQFEAGERLKGILEEYLVSADRALRSAPMMVTEAAVQEWLSRIDELAAQGRFSEVEQLHDWMNVAFGREDEDRARPLDPRLHRRLGSIYTKARRPAEASREFELACLLAPRDIFVLRSLGKSYLDQQRRKEAGEVLLSIEQLDPDAFVRNAESAALRARWYREEGNLDLAVKTLESALARNPTSYYLADLVAQVKLERGDSAGARSAFEQVLSIVERSREATVWTRASALTAALALGEEQRALDVAGTLRAMRPTPDEWARIDEGLESVAGRTNAGALLARVRETIRSSA